MLLADASPPPGGWITLGTVFITTTGSVAVALIGLYRRAGDIATKVNHQLDELLAKLEAEREAKEALAVELAVLKERLKDVDG